MIYNKPLFFITIVFVLTVSVYSESTDEKTNIIANSPPVFITENSIQYAISDKIIKDGEIYSSNREKAITVLKTLLSFDTETDGNDRTVSVILSKFHRFIHCTTQEGLYYTSEEAGSFQDWIQTKVMGIKTRIELDPPFNLYKAIDACPEFIVTESKYDLLNPTRRNGKLLNSDVNLRVYYTIYAGACALARIKGVDYGTEKSIWQKSISSSTGGSSAISSTTAGSGGFSSKTYTVKPRTGRSPGHSGKLSKESVSYAELLKTMPLGAKAELQLFSGSVLIGNITEISSKQIGLNIQGASRVNAEKSALKKIYLYVYK